MILSMSLFYRAFVSMLVKVPLTALPGVTTFQMDTLVVIFLSILFLEQGMTKITEANIALTIGQLLSCDVSQELQEIVLDLFINLSENGIVVSVILFGPIVVDYAIIVFDYCLLNAVMCRFKASDVDERFISAFVLFLQTT